MPRVSRLQKSRDRILAAISKASKKIYSPGQLADLYFQNRQRWDLPASTTKNDFIAFLLKEGALRLRRFHSPAYERDILRYTHSEVSPYELTLSLKTRSYFSHATGLALHGLNDAKPKTLYLNAEQSSKPKSSEPLTQEALDRAFSGKQRQSKLIYNGNGISVTMLSGKNTGRLGVEEIIGPGSERLQATNLERTLIDIVVRPVYAGGIPSVIKAYNRAKQRLQVDRLLEILDNLDHVYPYHQAVGFVMQQTGYPKESFSKFAAFGLRHNFYLSHAIKAPDFSEDWRIFYSKADLLKT